jgi:hypothetical protein
MGGLSLTRGPLLRQDVTHFMDERSFPAGRANCAGIIADNRVRLHQKTQLSESFEVMQQKRCRLCGDGLVNLGSSPTDRALNVPLRCNRSLLADRRFCFASVRILVANAGHYSCRSALVA